MMNVAASTGASETGSTTQTQAAQPKASNTSEKSFDEEMKTQSKEVSDKTSEETKTTDSKKENVSDKKTDTVKDKQSHEILNNDIISSEMISGKINFTDFKYHNESQSLLSQNIQNLLNTRDLMCTANSTIDYDVVNMSDSDANFFANLVQNTDMSMQSIAQQITEASDTKNIQSNVQVSSVLMEKLAESLKTNQPFRIDFDKDVSVIIKVNKDGSLMANFIPGDKAVEQYLRNNIASLRQRFDDENLSYSELSYSNSREQQQQRRKKENDNE